MKNNQVHKMLRIRLTTQAQRPARKRREVNMSKPPENQELAPVRWSAWLGVIFQSNIRQSTLPTSQRIPERMR
jgi:hypothetical protein